MFAKITIRIKSIPKSNLFFYKLTVLVGKENENQKTITFLATYKTIQISMKPLSMKLNMKSVFRHNCA